MVKKIPNPSPAGCAEQIDDSLSEEEINNKVEGELDSTSVCWNSKSFTDVLADHSSNFWTHVVCLVFTLVQTDQNEWIASHETSKRVTLKSEGTIQYSRI